MVDFKRNTIIDVMKGIGMLLVIIGHCVYFGGFIHNWIFSFHMPLFFILSGLFFRESSLPILLKKKTKSLLFPYVIFFIIGLLITLLIPAWRNKLSFSGIAIDIYLGNPGIVNVSSVWFLVCLFVSMLLLHMVLQIKKLNKKLSYIILGVVVIFGFICGKLQNIVLLNLPCQRLPLDIDTACVALLFIWAGYKFKDKIFKSVNQLEGKNLKQLRILLLGVGIIQILIVINNGRVNLYGMTYNNCILYIMEAIVGFSFICVFSVIISHFELIRNWLMWWGQNTIKILGVQAIAIRIYISMVHKFLGMDFQLYLLPPLYAAIDCVFSIAFSGIVVMLFNYSVQIIKSRRFTGV